MDWELFDSGLKTLAALSGIGLCGLMVVRTTPRGDWKLIGWQTDHIFEPKMVKFGRIVAWAFAIFVVMILARQS
ncbi:MAG TPA: hypothetical protein VEK08_17125 [Planctomycetota bacterium]|nr:hypothetical protein [Planctomycetota bacterium]